MDATIWGISILKDVKIGTPIANESGWGVVHCCTDMIFVKSFTQARFQQIWKFTPITRKPQHVLPPKTLFKPKQMWDSPTVLLRYALSFLYNIKLVKNYTKIFEITQDMSSPAKIYPKLKSFTQALLVMLVTNITSGLKVVEFLVLSNYCSNNHGNIVVMFSTSAIGWFKWAYLQFMYNCK